MIKNYFKIAWRNVLRNKGYSLLNIFGLAIGITCASLILLWVEDETSYDESIKDKNLVFKIPTNQKYDGEWRTFFMATPGPLAGVLKEEIPEILKTTRLRDQDFLFSVNDKNVKSFGAYADQDIIDIFNLDFIEGNAKEAFNSKHGIVITQKVASILFEKNKKVIGETIEVDRKHSFKVTGVIKDLPDNSTHHFSWLVPFENFTDGKEWSKDYGSNFTDTFVKIASGVNVDEVDEKVRAILPAKTGDEETKAILFSANDWHLRDNFKDGKIIGGRIEYVQLFSLIALIILAIACVNFMNLATARSQKRATEVGMRKALGSGRKQLIFQFITESLLTAGLASIISVIGLLLLLPEFNLLVDKNLSLDYTSPLHVFSLLAITLISGLLAGLYPAFYLSGFKPIDVLKGNPKNSWNASLIRKCLVVGQFATSIVLIIGTIIVYQQVDHIKNRNLGLDKDNLIEIPAAGGEIIKNFKLIEQELTSTGLVQSTGLMNSHILSEGNNTSSIRWAGKPENSDILISFRTVTPNFFDAAGMSIKEGRGFGKSKAIDSSSVLITETFAKLINTDDVLGSKIYWGDDELIVTGVVEDYLYGDMYGNSDPVVFFHEDEGADYMYIKPTEGVKTSLVLDKIEEIFNIYNPGFPFEYNFVDDSFNSKFKSEQMIGDLSKIFAIIAILISCIGLFGLSAYMAEQRKKEIGVRKVLGSSVLKIVKLLSKDFLILIFVALLFAIPLAWFIMHNWLQDYAYRINISWWIFALAGFMVISIAMLTVSFQAIKAATANPIKSLRTE
ncbi:ABC transporter permease [Psychroflexus montanilacus]|uniref:ABC transporter permease n=1 Tax=Psychroflexus montanilacus TaxID=2873598 RepID=UPI001CCA3DEB|nr:ABC transporter permease [Psychroflexus montanilacus]MBZ9650954.1 ABC transporter permease [Psychroflexus montanilacus]